MPSKERQLADKLVTAYNTLDVDTIIALRTPECKRVLLPSSLGYPPQSNEDFRANCTAMSQIFTSFKVEVDDVIEGMSDDGRKKLVMYISAFSESAIGPYRNQYIWRMGFTDDGELINDWSEFVDVGMVRDYFPKLQAEMVRRAEEASSRKKGEELGQAVKAHYMGMQGGEGGVK